MSSFMKATKRPGAKTFEDAWWIDDMYGKHRYGVVFKDGTAYKADDHEWETKNKLVDLATRWEDFPKVLHHE